LLQGRVR